MEETKKGVQLKLIDDKLQKNEQEGGVISTIYNTEHK